MNLFKFLAYSLAFMIGLSIAFCANTNYDSEPTYDFPDTVQFSTPKAQIPASEGNKNGKQLFKNNCAACHNKNMRDDMTGPALAGVRQRWEGREELLYDWIRNSQKVIASGDPYAVNLYNEWSKSVMTAFPNLSDEEVKDLLDYIDEVSNGI